MRVFLYDVDSCRDYQCQVRKANSLEEGFLLDTGYVGEDVKKKILNGIFDTEILFKDFEDDEWFRSWSKTYAGLMMSDVTKAASSLLSSVIKSLNETTVKEYEEKGCDVDDVYPYVSLKNIEITTKNEGLSFIANYDVCYDCGDSEDGISREISLVDGELVNSVNKMVEKVKFYLDVEKISVYPARTCLVGEENLSTNKTAFIGYSKSKHADEDDLIYSDRFESVVIAPDVNYFE